VAIVFSFNRENDGGSDEPPDRLFSPIDRIMAIKNQMRDPRRFSSSDAPDMDSDMVKSNMERDFDLIPTPRLFALLDMIENQLKKRRDRDAG